VSRLASALGAQPGEARGAFAGALLFFTLLASYFALRPVRDEMGVQAGLERLPELVTFTLLSMLVLSLAFGGLVARLPRRRFLPIALRAFALMLLGFAGWAFAGGAAGNVVFAKAWFVWLSVFNMFVVSLFWGFMADTWSPGQAKRLYGPIGVGGTLGAIAGGLLVPGVKALREALGEGGGLGGLLGWIFVASALLLEACVHLTRAVTRRAPATGDAGPAGAEAARDREVLGGGSLDGLKAVFSSRYLAGAALVVLLYSVVSTVLYVVRLKAVAASPLSPEARTVLFSWSEVAAQSLTLLTQLFLTSRLLPRLGTGPTLGTGPLVMALAFVAVAVEPALPLVVAAVALTRATHFALAKPAQETLFSVVERAEKYKAKSTLDTLGARLGDWLGTHFTALVGRWSATLPALAVAALPLCALWFLLSLALGRAYRRRLS
jgi:AAA family ATP:ADP antiporter